jgi:threonylcarbamoyladenosine tRNA methylthiotransferase MtaB
MDFYITTFGCRVNAAESIAWIQELEKIGYTNTRSVDKAQLHIINTCAVTHKAEREARKLLNHIARSNPKTKIVLTGCAATYWSRNKVKIKAKVDLIVTNKNKKLLVKKINELFKPKNSTLKNTIYGKFLDTGRLIVKVQDGCRYFCSYCIVPYLRGLPKSVLIDDVINYIENTQKSTEVNEVILSGINLGLYGEENNQTFSQLVKELLIKTNIRRISFGSLYPENITNEFLDLYSGEWKARLTNYFHIPIQNGANNILKLMKRRYTREEFKEKVTALIKKIPEALIATDIVIGFPNETEKDFKNGLNYILSLPVNKAHVFKFSQRKGTLANILEKRYGLLCVDDIKKRSKITRECFDKKFKEYQEKLTGKTMQALIIKKLSNKGYVGVLQNNIPIEIKCTKNLDRGIIDVTIDKYKNGKVFAFSAA